MGQERCLSLKPANGVGRPARMRCVRGSVWDAGAGTWVTVVLLEVTICVILSPSGGWGWWDVLTIKLQAVPAGMSL